MRRTFAFVLNAILVIALGACASPRFVADVTQFYAVSPTQEPHRFALIPTDEAKGKTLEFASYASLAVNQLQAQGFRQVDSIAQSDVVAHLDYGIGPGLTQSTPVPVYGYYPDQFSRVHGRTEDGKPFSADVHESGGYVPLGYADQLRTVYRRTLTLDLLDAAEWRRGQTKKVFEGRVVSVGPESELARVIPLMIRALFVEFPGPSGATHTIVLNQEPTAE